VTKTKSKVIKNKKKQQNSKCIKLNQHIINGSLFSEFSLLRNSLNFRTLTASHHIHSQSRPRSCRPRDPIPINGIIYCQYSLSQLTLNVGTREPQSTQHIMWVAPIKKISLLFFISLDCVTILSPKPLVSVYRFITMPPKKVSTRLVSISLTRDLEIQTGGVDDRKNPFHIIGVDEAGRGPLAGPVVAAACYIPSGIPLFSGIGDSKLLSEHEREIAYEVLIKHPDIVYDYSIISHEKIDEINILQASLLGMANSIEGVLKKLASDLPLKPSQNSESVLNEAAEVSDLPVKPKVGRKGKKASTQSIEQLVPESQQQKNMDPTQDRKQYLALIDGNKLPSNVSIPCKYVIQGDRKIYSIAAASIIAKVVRDRIMKGEYHTKYPIYNFAQHKGYPTAEHRALVLQYGPCEIHRRSYGPVKAALELWKKKEEKSINKGNKDGNDDDDDDTKKKKNPLKGTDASTPGSSITVPAKVRGRKTKTEMLLMVTKISEKETDQVENSLKSRKRKQSESTASNLDEPIKKRKTTVKIQEVKVTQQRKTSSESMKTEKSSEKSIDFEVRRSSRLQRK
jgi:ribonuclease HII